MPLSASPVGRQGTTQHVCLCVSPVRCADLSAPGLSLPVGTWRAIWWLGAGSCWHDRPVQRDREGDAVGERTLQLLYSPWRSLGKLSSHPPTPPHPSPSCPQCGYRQEGKWTYRCCIVLLRHCNTPESVICQKKTTKKYLSISQWELSAERWHRAPWVVWKYHRPVCWWKRAWCSHHRQSLEIRLNTHVFWLQVIIPHLTSSHAIPKLIF